MTDKEKIYFRERQRKLRKNPEYRARAAALTRKWKERVGYKTPRQDPAYFKRHYAEVTRWKRRAAQYGVTKEDFYRMVEAQGGKCAICGRNIGENAHVDHCHASGRVRGLLCNQCNTGIGALGDNPAILVAAAKYLS